MAGESEKKYLAFTLSDQEFAAGIDVVREIRGLEKVVPIPDSPDYLIGVMDLRGKVVPVVDLRRRFHQDPRGESQEDQVVVVVDMAEQVVGVLVDRVTEVLSLPDSAWEPPPSLFHGAAQRFLAGVANLEGRLIVLLDLALVLSHDEARGLLQLTEASA